jgi:hypothetical protein
MRRIRLAAVAATLALLGGAVLATSAPSFDKTFKWDICFRVKAEVGQRAATGCINRARHRPPQGSASRASQVLGG